MKKLCLPVLLFLFAAPAFSQTDMITKIAGLVRQGNAHELTALFTDDVEVTLPGGNQNYSKANAEAALNDFFNKTHPQSVKVFHKLTSNPSYQYAVLLLTSGQFHYRIDITLKQVNGTLQIIEMKIEGSKGK